MVGDLGWTKKVLLTTAFHEPVELVVTKCGDPTNLKGD